MATAATKSPFQTEAHAMAHHKTRAVKMDVGKITGAANHAAINSAVIIAVAMKVATAITVAAKQALATNVAGHQSLAESPESTANALATMGRSQRVLAGIRML